jgi:two-component system LytT family response regulator
MMHPTTNDASDTRPSIAGIRTVIVDDEAPARARMRSLLAAHTDVIVVRECSDGREAVEALTSAPVDLVFLDIQMPELDGFGVLAEVGPERMPPVIFTSAYSEYAVRAFEAYAVDYLLKPFDDTRLAAALDRAREQVNARQAPSPSEIDARLIGLLEHFQSERPDRFPEAIAIKTGTQYVVTRIADIDWIEADGNYAKLHIQKRPRLLTKSLSALEKDVLDPEVFVRVHRSAIVNTTKIAAAEPQLHGDLTLVLHDGTHVQCSRRFRKRLEEKLYFTT